MQRVNYIISQRMAFQRIRTVEIPGINICMMTGFYFALFQLWNDARFRETLQLSHKRGMDVTGIGSKDTYYKYLRAAEELGLLAYQPSKNQKQAPRIHMIALEITSNNDRNPSEIPQKSGTYLKKIKQDINPKKKVPSRIDVIDFFVSQGSTAENAEKFYLHNESTSWLHENQNIINWRPWAEKWIKNGRTKKNRGINQAPPRNERNKRTDDPSVSDEKYFKPL